FAASPLRGLTCASYPSGSSMNNPVLMMALSSDFSTTGASRLARRSIPADAEVSYDGSACFDLLMIFICMVLNCGVKVGNQEEVEESGERLRGVGLKVKD